MGTRQRLLLVAGWLIAAISAGLVASGAVAVAGGQVLDRPLRPLTAAEVAALPVATVTVPEPTEPHASGGSSEALGTDTSGSDPDVEGLDGPTGAGGPAVFASDDRTDVIEIGSDQRPTVRVAVVDGGRASFAASSDSLALLWATALPGHAAETRVTSETEIVVTFASADTLWLIEAAVEDGDLVIRTEELPFA